MAEGGNRKWDRLGKLVEEGMAANHVPGASIGLRADGQVFTTGLGVTNLDHPLPVQPSTLFQIGSITKTFTCIAIMRLVESGKLHLETPVRSLFPGFRVLDPEATSRVTIRHLLTHTAGWLGDFFIDTGPGEEALPKFVERMSELPQVVPIGLHYSYNNAAFALLGFLLERLEDKPYEQVITERVFGPAGLTRCYFKPEDILTRRFVVGHRVEADGAHVATPWAMPRCSYAEGAIVTDVESLLRYARIFIDGGRTPDGNEVLTPESTAAMQSPQVVIWKDRESVGLAWHIERHGDHELIHHGGATLGQIAYLEYSPRRDFALAILTNSDMGRHLVRAVRKFCLKEYLGVELPETKHIVVPTTALREIEGRYVLPRLGYTEIRILAGRLIGQDINTGGFPTEDTPPEPSPPPYTLAFTEPDRVVIADGKYKDTPCEILRDESGRMQWFRMGGPIHVREPLPVY